MFTSPLPLAMCYPLPYPEWFCRTSWLGLAYEQAHIFVANRCGTSGEAASYESAIITTKIRACSQARLVPPNNPKWQLNVQIVATVRSLLKKAFYSGVLFVCLFVVVVFWSAVFYLSSGSDWLNSRKSFSYCVASQEMATIREHHVRRQARRWRFRGEKCYGQFKLFTNWKGGWN